MIQGHIKGEITDLVLNITKMKKNYFSAHSNKLGQIYAQGNILNKLHIVRWYNVDLQTITLYCRINSRFTYKRNVRSKELSKAQKAQQFTPLVGDVLIVLKGLSKDIFA